MTEIIINRDQVKAINHFIENGWEHLPPIDSSQAFDLTNPTLGQAQIKYRVAIPENNDTYTHWVIANFDRYGQRSAKLMKIDQNIDPKLKELNKTTWKLK